MEHPPFVTDWPPETKDYSVTLNVGEVNGRLECVSVTVGAKRDGVAVSGSTLRALPIGKLMAEYVRRLRIEVAAMQIAPGPIDVVQSDGTSRPATPEEQRETDEFWAKARKWAEELAPILEKSGRYPPDHWEHVAEVYKAAVRWQRNPTAVVGEHYGVSRSAAAKWVSRARDRGLLPPARIGRADPPVIEEVLVEMPARAKANKKRKA
jgi:hypothetical protein